MVSIQAAQSDGKETHPVAIGRVKVALALSCLLVLHGPHPPSAGSHHVFVAQHLLSTWHTPHVNHCEYQPAASNHQVWADENAKSLLASHAAHLHSALHTSPRVCLHGDGSLTGLPAGAQLGLHTRRGEAEQDLIGNIWQKLTERSCFCLLVETLTIVYNLPDFL